MDKHYSIEAPEQARWAKATANQERNVTIYRPPRELYLLWTEQHDEVTLLARYSRSKQKRDEERKQQDDFGSTMKEYMTFQKQMTSIQLQKNMGESMTSLTHKEPSAAIQQQPVYQQQPLYQSQPASPASTLPVASSTMNSKKKKTAPPSIARKSSPIDSIVDNSMLVTEFFKWLVKKTPKERRNRLTEIYLVVLDQEWTMDDLKQMANPTSTPYRVAIQKGIPDGAARRFRTEIAQFGPHHRAAKALLGVAERVSNIDETGDDNTADKEENEEEGEEEA